MKSPAPPPARATAARSPTNVILTASVTAASLADGARKNYRELAEVSQIAALALERLEQTATPQEAGKTEIPTGDLNAIKTMLREIQTTSHAAFLQRHGAEADYRAIGDRVTKRHRTAGGRWR